MTEQTEDFNVDQKTIAELHERIDAFQKLVAARLEELAAAFAKDCNIPPSQCVLVVKQRLDGMEYHFEQKTSGITITPSESVYGFAAWLTCRKEQAIFSAADEASTAAELVDFYCQANHLERPREGIYPNNLTYPNAIVHV